LDKGSWSCFLPDSGHADNACNTRTHVILADGLKLDWHIATASTAKKLKLNFDQGAQRTRSENGFHLQGILLTMS
jgi:hypothetical protein